MTVWRLFILILFGTTIIASTHARNDTGKVYRVDYEATLDPGTGLAHATLELKQSGQLVRSISFHMPADRYRNVRSGSPVDIQGDQVIWQPAENGGTLQYDFIIDHERSNGARDSTINRTWALLKLDYLFPRASVRTLKGAASETTFRLSAPQGWSVETPYGFGADRRFHVSSADRSFDQPRGWLMAGKIGVRREKIGERHISVANPMGSGFRANDLLAFLRWTLPALVEVFPNLPQRLLIVSGSEDMWRGGLSGRSSLYIHPDRPLISGNRTSPILHELVHVASRMHGRADADWIVEGLAEYYSLTFLLRSDGISQFRYDRSFEMLARWSAGTACTATGRSQGKRTAAAALVMRALDTEIRTATDGRKSLDTLVQNLMSADRSITNADFRAAASELVKGPVRALANCP